MSNKQLIDRPKFPRLPAYDYSSAGGYFVTLCVADRECLLGSISDQHIILSEIGQIIATEWERSSRIRAEIELDVFVVMPNHLHGIVFIHEAESHCRARLRDDSFGNDTSHCRARLRDTQHRRKPHSLGSFIAGFKAYSTKRINELRSTPGKRLWQPDYYEHVIRNDSDLAKTREYIANNPQQWALDKENPDCLCSP